MAKYRCTVCNYVYDDAKEKIKFSDLPKEWVCPVCGAPKSAFVLLAGRREKQRRKRVEQRFLRFSLTRLLNGASSTFSAFPAHQRWVLWMLYARATAK